MNARHGGDGVLVGIAAVAAFSAGLIAVSQHADCTTAGYRLAVAQRENLELRRGVDQVARRVDALRTPQAAMARAAAMKLSTLKYPKTWNVVSAAAMERRAVETILPLSTFAPAAPMIPVATKGTAR
jgi:hypothetical protein